MKATRSFVRNEEHLAAKKPTSKKTRCKPHAINDG
jgi:hypothetical protein